MRAYLSGGMEYADGEGANWRKEMQDWLQTKVKHSVFNPNVESDIFFADRYPNIDFREIKKTNTELYQEIVRHLVDIDCKEIADHSDYVICYWDEGAAKGAGTKGELTMARYFNKPVYLVTSFQLYDIPGWVLGCTSNIFKTFEELKQFLSNR
jgi:hypothetical protein